MCLELAEDFLAERVGCLGRGSEIIMRKKRARLPLDQRGGHVEPLDIEIQVCERGLVDVVQEPGGERRQVDPFDRDVLPADLVDQEIDRPGKL